LTATQLHCATVPDGPDRKWSGGSVERIEAANRRALEQHFDRLDRTAIDYCSICGRDDDLVDYKISDQWTTTCRDCRAKSENPAPLASPAVKALTNTIPADLSIPDFLRR
jgi:hypothetical protein